MRTTHTMRSALLSVCIIEILCKPVTSDCHICRTPLNQTIEVAERVMHVNSEFLSVGSLRITPYYTLAFENAAQSEAVKTQFVEPAIAYWSKALEAKSPISDVLSFARQCNGGLSRKAVDIDGVERSFCTYGCKAQSMCYTEPIPDEYLDQCLEIINGTPQRTGYAGAGLPNTDMLILVDASATSTCDGVVLAYATTCQLEVTLDRPVLGYINLCPSSIGFNYPDIRIVYSAILHEFGHALGFSSLLYAFMRDTDGNPRTPRDPNTNLPNLGRTDHGTFRAASSTIDIVNREWKAALGTFSLSVWTLKTPHVLGYARTHFDCPTLDGVDLENEGGSGTAISHFEKRIGNNDLMTGSIEQLLVPSPLTLSFFQDTGWYNVDMSRAADWKWGKGLGCTFVQKSCYEFMESRTREQSIRPWCAEPPAGQTECLSYDNAFGQCDLRMHSSILEAEYQYFRQLPNVPTSMVPYYGGKHSLMDRCPFIRPWFGNGSESSSYCDVTTNQIFFPPNTNKWLQFYGVNSFCLDHINEPWTSAQCYTSTTMKNQVATCHKFSCSSTLGLILTLEGKSFQCPLEGGTIQIDTVGTYFYLTGKANCPPCSTACNDCPEAQEITSSPDAAPAEIPCGSRTLRSSDEFIIHAVISAAVLTVSEFI